MKKFAALILFCVYSLASLGIGIEQFYCCGKLKSTVATLFHTSRQSEKNCPPAMAASMKNCCKKNIITLQVKDSHIASDVKFSFAKFQFESIFQQFFLLPEAQIIPSANSLCYYSKAPPPSRNIPLYIQYCAYRI
ncbi:HYC_CC_PP family protein [Pinibacter soli]|uniref:Uncharacterized protein n=1 Tax=Pinibacter soli TaxID=3044211 RepID=A0ABT6RBT2_9BACT|nr:hypothetical protein [Pinibacter soli]MDI3320019.1 hypothetical protein [Pinibacter soli]